MQYSKGKTFLSPSSLFRREKALFFPNLQGTTLASPQLPIDTTPLLAGKVSIISLFSGTWAERQTLSFVGENPYKKKVKPKTSLMSEAEEDGNNMQPAVTPLTLTVEPELDLNAIIEASDGLAQQISINIEHNPLKHFLIRLFFSSLRRRMPASQHDKYFLIRRGITEELRDKIGMLNSKVGYVYLVDGEGRIRWAGSGRSEGEERAGLGRGAERLIAEAKRLGDVRRTRGKGVELDEMKTRQDGGSGSQQTSSETTPKQPVREDATRTSGKEPAVYGLASKDKIGATWKNRRAAAAAAA
ncbi:Mitochondrial ATPase complex subunit atp10 [Ptychographa xylographoides]|nr:Mitochondrial ATPase complex subunit atp10 [Ptychographa xylographoides]